MGGFAACACALCRTVLPEAPLIDTCWQISCSQAAAAIVAAARAAAGGWRRSRVMQAVLVLALTLATLCSGRGGDVLRGRIPGALPFQD